MPSKSKASKSKASPERTPVRWRRFTPGAVLVGLILMAFGASVSIWKIGMLGMPVVPSDPEGLWNMEVVVTAHGDGQRGNVQLALPPTRPGQRIYDERFAADGLALSIQRSGRARTAVWTGKLDGEHRIVYGFRAQLTEGPTRIPDEGPATPPERITTTYTATTPDLPAGAPELLQLLERPGLSDDADPALTLRALHAFVAHDIRLTTGAPDDALLTLAQREGNELGKTKLLVSLLRTAHIPARVVRGLQLRDGRTPEPRVWADAWIKGRWISVSSGKDFFAERPKDFIALQESADALLGGEKTETVTAQYQAIKERLRPEETSAIMMPASKIFRRVSLYRLPPQAQSVLRLLLLFPLGAFILALFRNLIGVQTYGTFMPVLIAFALRGTGLLTGLFLVALVLAVGAAGRVLLERLRLMIVPRLAIMMCVVVLCVTGLSLAGLHFQFRDLYSGLLFPLIILTMLIERFSVTIVEEGPRSAAVGAGWTTLVSVAIYPVMRSDLLGHVFFGFPELIFCVIGALVLIGGYTGYRLFDLWRFRALIAGGRQLAEKT